jgi:hypothetical protein
VSFQFRTSINPSIENPMAGESLPEGFCPDYFFLKFQCTAHKAAQWKRMPCKRRSCPICGPKIRLEQQQRIAYGIRKLWPAALLVLTFKAVEDGNTCYLHGRQAPVADCLTCKTWATSQLARFVAKLRRRLTDLEYVATYEQHKSGVLHINLVVARWDRIPLPELLRLWGRRLSSSWVVDDVQASAEIHKRRVEKSPDGLGAYLVKIAQQVERGRSISFSKGWPEVPQETAEFEGEITASLPEGGETVQMFLAGQAGWIREDAPGMFYNALDTPEPCDCFRLKPTTREHDGQMLPPSLNHWTKPWLDAPKRYKPGRGALS